MSADKSYNGAVSLTWIWWVFVTFFTIFFCFLLFFCSVVVVVVVCSIYLSQDTVHYTPDTYHYLVSGKRDECLFKYSFLSQTGSFFSVIIFRRCEKSLYSVTCQTNWYNILAIPVNATKKLLESYDFT